MKVMKAMKKKGREVARRTKAKKGGRDLSLRCAFGKKTPSPKPSQRRAEIAGVPYWTSQLPARPLPTRGKDGCLVFADFPSFRPNLTPEEVLRVGAFGGGYFRSIRSSVTKKTYRPAVHEEFPPSWFSGVDVASLITSSRYNAAVNLYGVTCGNSLEFWQQKGWMRAQDPYGWFQWYCRFFLGRRTADDERQVGRWVSAIGEKGRWRTFLVGQCIRAGKVWDDPTASPVTRQTLLHWGYRMTKADFDVLAPAIAAGKSVIYMGQAVPSRAAKRPTSAVRGRAMKRSRAG
eukprot:gnl/TRDRNA2_/TRDRNA2_43394_c0_seq1.p1 gnl/TRDRNA2_/TRDRNA2_43394_c0~~gnl/TRDRNA2_/TRDRNA2_43394_c0_seq1.p1  ORF type:complete len:289 (+),score=36.38 gnl/TRDRNA2_/TRDRNA2_43394_c0_seq1:1-867(+)